jgi:hypothetical protein
MLKEKQTLVILLGRAWNMTELFIMYSSSLCFPFFNYLWCSVHLTCTNINYLSFSQTFDNNSCVINIFHFSCVYSTRWYYQTVLWLCLLLDFFVSLLDYNLWKGRNLVQSLKHSVSSSFGFTEIQSSRQQPSFSMPMWILSHHSLWFSLLWSSSLPAQIFSSRPFTNTSQCEAFGCAVICYVWSQMLPTSSYDLLGKWHIILVSFPHLR